MEHERFEREIRLIGAEDFSRIAALRVAVIGLGGVGSGAVEALARCGVGSLFIMDCDCVDITNINRQLIALSSSVGERKVEAWRRRILDISPDCRVESRFGRFDAAEPSPYEFRPDYVIDAVDDVSAKLALIEGCERRGIKIISCMGTGNITDPFSFKIGGISDTAGCGCPLARVMRREAKKRGLGEFTVLYSVAERREVEGRTPASISFCPPVAGYLMASHVINSLLNSTP